MLPTSKSYETEQRIGKMSLWFQVYFFLICFRSVLLPSQDELVLNSSYPLIHYCLPHALKLGEEERWVTNAQTPRHI